MNVDRISLMEHLAFASPLNLKECCHQIRDEFHLPEFSFDSENATEWGLVTLDHIQYNISRPFNAGTLQSWDSSTPEGCNFGLTYIIFNEHPMAGNHEWALNAIVRRLSRRIETTIHYHRTWFGVGDNVSRNEVFEVGEGQNTAQ